jgi:hypothetical protein
MTLGATDVSGWVAMSKDKFAELAAYLAALQGWIVAAAGCLEANRAAP